MPRPAPSGLSCLVRLYPRHCRLPWARQAPLDGPEYAGTQPWTNPNGRLKLNMDAESFAYDCCQMSTKNPSLYKRAEQWSSRERDGWRWKERPPHR